MRITQETKQETRRRILAAARKLFAKNGLENTTTRAIAHDAKIATGTLFNYFQNKEAIAMTFVSEALAEAKSDFLGRRRGDESLEEDCFAHAIAGFRRLTPCRHLVGAVIEAALGPFSKGEANPEAEAVRAEHLETVAELLAAHGATEPLSPVAIHLYWTLYLGALGFWAADMSVNQEESVAVLDQSMRLFVASLSMNIQRTEVPMALALDELLAALPAEADEAEPLPAAIEEIFEKLAHRPVPVGSLARLWTLGTLQAKIAAAYMAYWVRCGFLSSDDAARRLNDTHLAAAIKLLGGMSYLRGAIMKVGQVLANYPNLLPEHYAEALAKLHFEAPAMHYSLLREHVRNELGRDPEELFESFETRAFAAASLGQVHRARLKSGEPVAVKIQYPNIARTIRSDFRSLSAVFLPMRLTADWQNQREQFEYVRRSLEQETDYEREAEALRRARLCLSQDDDVVVPRVYQEFSTRRVLTMDYLAGKHLDLFLATNPPQELRDRHGAQIMRSSLWLYYREKLMYSDVQPGNFLFLDDGRLGLLDFGGCRTFSDDEWDTIRSGHKAFRGTREDVVAHCVRSAMLTDAQRADTMHVKLLEDITYWLWEPFKHEGPFDFGDADYFQRGMAFYAEMFRRRSTRGMPFVTLLTRMFLGFRAMACRLGCRVDARRAMDDELRLLGW